MYMAVYQSNIREADIDPTLYIMKRSGERCEFDQQKIQNAIEKANDSMDMPNDKLPPEEIEAIAFKITRRAERAGRELSVEEIQDMVEEYLMMSGKTDLARKYITYRYVQNQKRNKNSLDKKIESIINVQSDDVKQENSNKDPTVVSVQRDYMAGEWSRHYTRTYLLPKDIQEAHDQGIIHFHDSDYFAQKEHNCFAPHTEFIANGAIATFNDFKDGDTVKVLDKDGVERTATVKYFGRKAMQTITLTRSSSNPTNTVHIVCTSDHRWILKDGTVTTNLQVKDILYHEYDSIINEWTVSRIEPYGENIPAWCIVEPVTHSFQLKHEIVTGNCELINLEDMLQNGTKISGTLIETPKSFATACTITSQIIAQV